jgi:hypothetical protein
MSVSPLLTINGITKEKTLMDKLRRYWDYAAERAAKTLAQTALATIGVGAVGILEVDWVNVASVSALAGIMSLLTSVLQYDRVPVEEK